MLRSLLLLFSCIVSLTSSVIINRNKTDFDIPVFGGRISDQVCSEYGALVPTRLYPYIENSLVANNEFPHMAAIYGYRENGFELEFFSAGTLISPEFVVTIAHFYKRNNVTNVLLGTSTLPESKTSEKMAKIAKIIIHPDFTQAKRYNDISLIQLSEPVKFSLNIQPACLYTDLEDPNIVMTAPGWGLRSVGGTRVSSLSKATSSIITNEECNRHYHKRWGLAKGITSSLVCTVDRTGGTGLCKGDSGGPLQFVNSDNSLYTVVGISSFGVRCNNTIPAAFVRISSYLDWIEPKVWP